MTARVLAFTADDAEARRKKFARRSTALIVEAAAGTGKTTELINRISACWKASVAMTGIVASVHGEGRRRAEAAASRRAETGAARRTALQFVD
jgi:hypothetical protein